MPIVIAVIALFAALVAAETDAETEAEKLAEMFSPILILTEETGGKWGDIIVTKPEPVGIMGATSVDRIWFQSLDIEDRPVARAKGVIGSYPSSLIDIFEAKCPNVDFSENKFAFLTRDCLVSHSGLHPNEVQFIGKVRPDHFDFSGTGTTGWNAEYKRIGENFPNTAYVHIYKRVVDQYRASHDSITVIQYHYFYPYNDWWNDHEGDWQQIDVVVRSSDPDTAVLLGVEFRFHGAWLNYYKDWGSKPGLTSSFQFNPRTAVKLSPGPSREGIVQYTHPVVYVGAGSHGAYPVGGKIKIYKTALELIGDVIGLGQEEAQAAVGGDFEYMTHTGLVLATQAPTSGSSLWERYDLQLLPEPDLNNTDNMGLADTLSWLGAKIRWGTPSVDGPRASKPPLSDGNQSPKDGPYNRTADCFSLETIPPACGWGKGKLRFFEVAETGFTGAKYKIQHENLPYRNYHHWSIIGNETLNGTVSLQGDIVIFPGATLTVDAGSVVEFEHRKDRHQFHGQGHGTGNRSEIFVYGTLKTEGTVTDSIFFQRSGNTRSISSGAAFG